VARARVGAAPSPPPRPPPLLFLTTSTQPLPPPTTQGPTGYSSRSTAEQVVANWDGRGKTVVITGGSTGLGLESAAALAGRGAHVVIGARDAGKAKRACERVKRRHPHARVQSLRLDLSDLDGVREFAAEVKALPEVSTGGLYCLQLNAGTMALPKRAAYPMVGAEAVERDEDRPDLQFLTNHVGHHLLCRLLEPELKRAGAAAQAGSNGADAARAVFLSSCAHFTTYPAAKGGPVRLKPFGGPKNYEPWGAYSQSKLCNLLDARETARRWQAEAGAGAAPSVVSVACHPGVIVATDLFRNMPGILGGWAPARAVLSLLLKPFLKSVPQGAATQTFLSSAPIARGGGKEPASGVRNGGYYADVNISPTSYAGEDDALGGRLFDVTEGLCGAAACV
jgi:WW domain-containing oxidoreductase